MQNLTKGVDIRTLFGLLNILYVLGNENRCENADDGDDNDQLYESEALFGLFKLFNHDLFSFLCLSYI